MISPSPFFHFFNKHPYSYIIGGHIWLPGDFDSRNKEIEIDELTFALHQGPSLKELEDDYYTEFQSGFEAKIHSIAKKNLSAGGTENYLLDNLKYAELAYFVIDEVIAAAKVGRTHRQVHPLGKTPIQKMGNESIHPSGLHFTLRDLLKHKDYSTTKGMFFQIKAKIFSLALSAPPSRFSFGKFYAHISELERRYQNSLEQQMEALACAGDDSLIARLESAKRKKDVIKALPDGEYTDSQTGVGFRIQQDRFFVTRVVQPYSIEAIIDGGKTYFNFPEAIIGIEVEKKLQSINWDDPIVLNEYSHPALQNRGKEGKICMGKTSMQEIRDSGNSLSIQLDEALELSFDKLREGYYPGSGAWNELFTEKYARIKSVFPSYPLIHQVIHHV